MTGATGFLGRHLLPFLAAQPGIKVWAVSNHGGQVGDIAVDAVDLTSKEDFSAWYENKPGFAAIFHLAAAIPASFDTTDLETLFLPNLLINSNTCDKAILDKAVLIYTSSSSLYGSNPSCPCHEEMLVSPDNWYSLAKYFGELLGQMSHQRSGLQACSLRISAPYGPGQKTRSVINIFLEAALNSRDLVLFGSGERSQDFTYVADVLQAMWLAFQKGASGVYNVASGHPTSMRQLAESVLSLVPSTKSKITFSGQDDPQENYRGEFAIDKARRELGYNPLTTIQDGLKACLQAKMTEHADRVGG